jgi:hypothetical protein
VYVAYRVIYTFSIKGLKYMSISQCKFYIVFLINNQKRTTMTTDLDSIKQTLVGVSQGDTILDTLLEFERTLDNAELFAYKNWILGELVEGPTIGRYWYKTVWMFPANLMPDPNGGLRLTKIGAKVNFKKGIFKRPVRVKGPEDWIDPQSKRAKMEESEIWLVTIELPIKYIDRGLEKTNDIIQKDIEDTNAELEGAYEDQAPGAEDMNAGAGQDMGNEMPPEDEV